jgi:hypothetical protein
MNNKYHSLHQSGKYIKTRPFCSGEECTQCENILGLHIWGFVYKRQLFLERKLQVLNTVFQIDNEGT